MLRIGISGSRGLDITKGFRAIEGVEITALCDIDEGQLKKQAAAYRIPKTFRVFEDMLETDIDAVVISTPMQLHFSQTMRALEAGKHVLSEVTAGVMMDELWWLIECVEKYRKVYMLSENFCYIPENQIIKAMVREGLFGEVYFGEGEYLHEAKETLSVYPNGKASWRSYWHYGKRGVFYPSHSLGPLMQWFGGDRIDTVQCVGSGWHTSPEFRQEDTSIALCKMKSGKLIKLRIDCLSNRPHNIRYYSLQGTLGCYEAPRGLGDDHKIWLKGMDESTEAARWRPLKDFGEYLPERYKTLEVEIIPDNHWGGDYFIARDFVDAATKDVKPAIDVYDACEWTAVALLSELSVMNGGRVMKMPDFRKNLTNADKIINI